MQIDRTWGEEYDRPLLQDLIPFFQHPDLSLDDRGHFVVLLLEHHRQRLDQICGHKVMRQQHIVSPLLVHLQRALAALRGHDDLRVRTGSFDQFDDFPSLSKYIKAEFEKYKGELV